MLDATLRCVIDRALIVRGRGLAGRGVKADAITLAGLVIGMVAAALVALGHPGLALAPLLLSRVFDGLDGAVARAGLPTEVGGYLDISADFLFYGAVPLAFVLADPARNGAAGAFLLCSFYVNGATFLGYAMMAVRRGLTTTVRGVKSLYFSGGLPEGTETILFLSLLCFRPGAFVTLTWVFSSLCFHTAAQRVLAARQRFGAP